MLESLLKEKSANAHLVQKLRVRCKKFQNQKQQKKEIPPSTSQTEIRHIYQRMLKLIKGNFTDDKKDPTFEILDELLDDIQQIRQIVSKTDNDEFLEIDILVKRLRTENNDLRRKDERGKCMIDRLEQYLYSKEEKIERLEAQIETIKQTKEEEIKSRVDIEVRRRLLTLPTHVSSASSDICTDLLSEPDIEQVLDDAEAAEEDDVYEDGSELRESAALSSVVDTRRGSLAETTAWGAKNTCVYIINPTNVNINN